MGELLNAQAERMRQESEALGRPWDGVLPIIATDGPGIRREWIVGPHLPTFEPAKKRGSPGNRRLKWDSDFGAYQSAVEECLGPLLDPSAGDDAVWGVFAKHWIVYKLIHPDDKPLVIHWDDATRRLFVEAVLSEARALRTALLQVNDHRFVDLTYYAGQARRVIENEDSVAEAKQSASGSASKVIAPTPPKRVSVMRVSLEALIVEVGKPCVTASHTYWDFLRWRCENEAHLNDETQRRRFESGIECEPEYWTTRDVPISIEKLARLMFAPYAVTLDLLSRSDPGHLRSVRCSHPGCERIFDKKAGKTRRLCDEHNKYDWSRRKIARTTETRRKKHS